VGVGKKYADIDEAGQGGVLLPGMCAYAESMCCVATCTHKLELVLCSPCARLHAHARMCMRVCTCVCACVYAYVYVYMCMLTRCVAMLTCMHTRKTHLLHACAWHSRLGPQQGARACLCMIALRRPTKSAAQPAGVLQACCYRRFRVVAIQALALVE
jgi:hypothetical protein